VGELELELEGGLILGEPGGEPGGKRESEGERGGGEEAEEERGGEGEAEACGLTPGGEGEIAYAAEALGGERAVAAAVAARVAKQQCLPAEIEEECIAEVTAHLGDSGQAAQRQVGEYTCPQPRGHAPHVQLGHAHVAYSHRLRVQLSFGIDRYRKIQL
jgi:hypothetical protein